MDPRVLTTSKPSRPGPDPCTLTNTPLVRLLVHLRQRHRSGLRLKVLPHQHPPRPIVKQIAVFIFFHTPYRTLTLNQTIAMLQLPGLKLHWTTEMISNADCSIALECMLGDRWWMDW